MTAALLLLMLSGLMPLLRAWSANGRTSLVQAMHWVIAAWLAWTATVVTGERVIGESIDPARYLALCLTGCAGIAVLGARRPYVGAWNFVVLGLLAVLVLPLIEGLLIRDQPPGTLYSIFLAAVLSVGILNYLPTCLAPAALLLGLAEAGQLLLMLTPGAASPTLEIAANVCLILAPWIANTAWKRHALGENEFDSHWLFFRNRFGLMWSQRLREQFNHAARNAGWPVTLTWRGLRRTGGPEAPMPSPVEVLERLQALLKRFE